MALEDEEERRRAKRLKVRIPIGIYFPNKPYDAVDAELRDISMFGAFIECSEPLEVGSKVLIEIRLGQARFLPGIVKILEGQSVPDLPPGVPPSAVIRWGEDNVGFGIEFQQLDAEKTAFLKKLIKYLEEKAAK